MKDIYIHDNVVVQRLASIYILDFIELIYLLSSTESKISDIIVKGCS